jgi:hypothetical protein
MILQDLIPPWPVPPSTFRVKLRRLAGKLKGAAARPNGSPKDFTHQPKIREILEILILAKLRRFDLVNFPHS